MFLENGSSKNSFHSKWPIRVHYSFYNGSFTGTCNIECSKSSKANNKQYNCWCGERFCKAMLIYHLWKESPKSALCKKSLGQISVISGFGQHDKLLFFFFLCVCVFQLRERTRRTKSYDHFVTDFIFMDISCALRLSKVHVTLEHTSMLRHVLFNMYERRNPPLSRRVN